MAGASAGRLAVVREEFSRELQAILDFWASNSVDETNGGFIGAMDNSGTIDPFAPKGVVLNSRILWTFSAGYVHSGNKEYLKLASRAFHYIVDHFIDRRYGGVYWSVDYLGNPLDTRKQVYGLAFCMYGLAEYYQAAGDPLALHLAKDLYARIEQYSYDTKRGGYIEAFTQGWKINEDLRLSTKDDNEKKTANTHLHVIEAYASLYQIWPDASLAKSIQQLLDVFDQYIINRESHHLRLFLDENWVPRSSLISFGHDIEAAWLLYACAGLMNSPAYVSRFGQHALLLTEGASEGLDEDGGLWYEMDMVTGHLVKEKHWWPQAEAVVGFYHAFELSGDSKFLDHSLAAWTFVKNHIRDESNGEWYWGILEDYSVMDKEKAGFWKCPYHNGRACIEMIRRINNYLTNNPGDDD